MRDATGMARHHLSLNTERCVAQKHGNNQPKGNISEDILAIITLISKQKLLQTKNETIPETQNKSIIFCFFITSKDNPNH